MAWRGDPGIRGLRTLPLLRCLSTRSSPPQERWGGLRGGLSIALALNLPDAIGDGKDLILILTYGVVLFTILVQGLTLKKIVK